MHESYLRVDCVSSTEPLSEHDKERIKTLEQVHILARHGTRIIPTSIHDIFPNSTEKFECEWNGMSTRYFKNSKDWMSLQLHFVNNENIVEGNCAVSQSLSDVIPQVFGPSTTSPIPSMHC